MIRIGPFIFPRETTSVQMEKIEAKSKVRKKYRIQSLLRYNNPEELQRSLEKLQSALEDFDLTKNELSVHPGRYHHGRQRHFHVVPSPCGTLAFIDLTILTFDRYERSLIFHQHSMDLSYGRAVFSLFQMGNWKAPLHAHIQLFDPITSLILQFEEQYTITEAITAGKTITIDSELRRTYIDNKPLYTSASTIYPYLIPGSNQVTITIEPYTAKAACRLQYQDQWV